MSPRLNFSLLLQDGILENSDVAGHPVVFRHERCDIICRACIRFSVVCIFDQVVDACYSAPKHAAILQNLHMSNYSYEYLFICYQEIALCQQREISVSSKSHVESHHERETDRK